MDNAPIGVIVNPQAGAGKGIGLLPRIVSTLASLERPHHLHVTTAPGEAVEVARRFAVEGAPIVIAVGGDGTVNEVANGLIESGQPTLLGVIPGGRGSDFVRSVGTPRDVPTALAHLLRAKARRIDVGRATFADGASRVFVNAAGLGFDAAVAERASRSRMPGSTLPYLSGLVGALIRYVNLEAVVTADDRQFVLPVRSVIAANGRYLGGGMKLVPTADLADGLLDLAIIGDIARADLVRNVPRLYRGTHVNHPKFTHIPARSIRIETASPARVQLDGELFGASPVTLSVEPAALFVTE